MDLSPFEGKAFFVEAEARSREWTCPAGHPWLVGAGVPIGAESCATCDEANEARDARAIVLAEERRPARPRGGPENLGPA